MTNVPDPPKPDDDLLALMRRRFQEVNNAEEDQRKEEKEDLEFQVPELQWDLNARRQREGNTGGGAGVPIPPRPCLSIPKLNQPIQLVTNQQRQAHLGVNVHPISEGADDETAEVLQGVYRDIERRSNAGVARTWAFERAVEAGRGNYRVTTVWDEESDHPFDQMIVIERILNQENVYWDPSATMADFSDAEYCFVAGWVPANRFKAEWPDAEIPSKQTFANQQEESPLWVDGIMDGDGNPTGVRVVEYWEKRHNFQEIVQLDDGSICPANEIPKGRKRATYLDRAGETHEVPGRKRDVVTIYRHTATACDVLETVCWPGKYIPIIFVAGRELLPFDERRRWQGMVRPARDAQRMFNYAASQAVEMAALEPKAPWILAEGQVENYRDMWQQSNVRNFPYLTYTPVTIGDAPAPPPQRVQVDTSRLGPSMQLLQIGDQFIQSATSISDPALGRLNENDRSGKAILALQGQADASTSGYLANLAQISMVHEARVVLDLIPYVYDRPGRIARLLDDEDEERTVLLNAPFQVDDDERPVPVEVPEGQALPPGVKKYDLAKGRYGVSVTIGKNYQTRLQQGADELGQILSASPEMMLLVGDLYFGFRDFPSAKTVSQRLRKIIEMKNPELFRDDDDAETPDQLRARLADTEQKMQVLQQQLGQAVEMLKTEQAKQQATLEKANLDAQSREAVAQINAQTKLMVEQIKAENDLALERMQAEVERMKAMLQVQEGARDREHELGLERAKAVLGRDAQANADRREDEREMREGGEGGEE